MSLLLYDIGVEHALLLQIMRNGILGQKWRLEPDFGSDPGAFGISVPPCFAWRHGRGGRGHMAWEESAAAELGTEVGALNLIELLDLAPGFVAYRTGYVDFQSHDRHVNSIV